MSDLIPNIHEASSHKKLFDWRPILFLLGIAIVAVAIQLAHSYIDTEHAHDKEVTAHSEVIEADSHTE